MSLNLPKKSRNRALPQDPKTIPLETILTDISVNPETVSILQLLSHYLDSSDEKDIQSILCRYDADFLSIPPFSKTELIKQKKLPRPRPSKLRSTHDLNTLDFEMTDYIAVDCEMVVSRNKPCLARVSAVNEFGVVLYDTYVRPHLPVTDYVTRYSGISAKILAEAERKNNIVDFRQAQLDILGLITGRYLVGHAVNNDLQALQLHHPGARTIDTQMLLSAVKGRGLKRLMASMYGIPIQTSKSGHDSVQDALATMLLFRTLKSKYVDARLKTQAKPGLHPSSPTQIMGIPEIAFLHPITPHADQTPRRLDPQQVCQNSRAALLWPELRKSLDERAKEHEQEISSEEPGTKKGSRRTKGYAKHSKNKGRRKDAKKGEEKSSAKV